MPQAGTAILPNGYGLTVTNVASQVLGQNPTRQGLLFYNPTSATIAFCPGDGLTLKPILNGAGSMTIGLYGWVILDTAVVTSAWQAIASGIAPFTIWEW